MSAPHYKILLFIAILLTPYGCRKEKDIRRVVVESHCKGIIENPEVPEHRKKLAKKVLDGWNNKVIDRKPILVHAGYLDLQDPNKDYLWLLLTMSDEEYDISGFVVREAHKQSNSNDIIIEENYPVFPESVIGHFQSLHFRERRDLLHIKDEKAWNNYLNARDTKDILYRRKKYPVILLSLPNESTVEVEILIYDSRGNKSEPIPLEYGVNRWGIKKPIRVTESSVFQEMEMK